MDAIFDRTDEEAKQREQGQAPDATAMSDSTYKDTAGGLTNMQDHFMQIMNNEQVEDIVDLLNRHSFEETNCCDFVVHAREERLCPLWSILHPNS